MSKGAAAARAKAQDAHTADAAVHGAHGDDRGFTKLDFELNDYPGPVKTSLFGIQHVLVMFTAMVGGPADRRAPAQPARGDAHRSWCRAP